VIAEGYDLDDIDPNNKAEGCHLNTGISGIDVTISGSFKMKPRGLNRCLLQVGEHGYRTLVENAGYVLSPCGRDQA